MNLTCFSQKPQLPLAMPTYYDLSVTWYSLTQGLQAANHLQANSALGVAMKDAELPAQDRQKWRALVYLVGSTHPHPPTPLQEPWWWRHMTCRYVWVPTSFYLLSGLASVNWSATALRLPVKKTGISVNKTSGNRVFFELLGNSELTRQFKYNNCKWLQLTVKQRHKVKAYKITNNSNQ